MVARFQSNMMNRIMWSDTFTVIYESVTQLTMALLLFVLRPRFLMDSTRSYTEIMSDIFGGMCGLMLFFLFFMSIRILRVHETILQHPLVIRRYGVLYEHIKISTTSQRLTTFMFMYRRFIVCFMYIFMSNWVFFQIQFTLIQNIVFIIHLGIAEPYTTRSENRKELFNEMFIIFMSTILILFSDFALDSDF